MCVLNMLTKKQCVQYGLEVTLHRNVSNRQRKCVISVQKTIQNITEQPAKI